RPLAELRQLPVCVRANLFELGGCYSGHEAGCERGEPGMGQNQLRSGYPTWDIDSSISEAGWWGREYETWEQGRARAASVAQWLASQLATTSGTHLLVIHADFKRLLLEALFSDAQLDALQIDLAAVPLYNTGISCLEHSAEGWSLSEFNSTKHLPNKLVT
ncbi:MAG: histidine phosphatase family protein, partial [Aureliella sp.]